MNPSTGRTLSLEPWPDVAGRPGLVQGRYGAQGNIEIVAPAVDDGLWVGWFNSDVDDDRTTARSRSWSGALRFGRGRRYVSADITQLTVGPDWLEVVALTDSAELVRHVWSPDLGFVEQPVLRRGVRDHSALVVSPDGTHHIAVLDLDGRLVVLSGSPETAPLWSPAEMRVGSGDACVSASWHRDHLDVVSARSGRTVLLCADDGAGRSLDVPPARLVADDERRRLVRADVDDRTSLVDVESIVPAGFSADANSVAAALVTLDGVAGVHAVVRRGTGLWSWL